MISPPQEPQFIHTCRIPFTINGNTFTGLGELGVGICIFCPPWWHKSGVIVPALKRPRKTAEKVVNHPEPVGTRSLGAWLWNAGPVLDGDSGQVLLVPSPTYFHIPKAPGTRGNQDHTGIPYFLVLCCTAFSDTAFANWKLWQLCFQKVYQYVFPATFAHFVSLLIISIFQTLLVLLPLLMMICDQQLWLTEHSDDA